MSVSIRGAGGITQEVDAGSLAARVTSRPQRALAWNAINATTGLATAVAANAPLFSLRNTGANLILIRKVGLGVVLTTAFTTAQILEYAMTVGRNWTTNDAGGTDVTPTGNDQKRRTSLTTPNVHIRVATTTGLTPGTRTLDAQPQARHAFWAGAVGSGIEMEPYNLFSADQPGDHPITLAQNEGIAIWNPTLMGAAGVQRAFFHVEYAEVAPSDFT